MLPYWIGSIVLVQLLGIYYQIIFRVTCTAIKMFSHCVLSLFFIITCNIKVCLDSRIFLRDTDLLDRDFEIESRDILRPRLHRSLQA